MPQNFLYPQRDQPLLLPVDMREWLPGDDLVFVVLDAVATVDLGGFRRRYRADGHGRAASGPEMMVALLLCAYSQGERPRPGDRDSGAGSGAMAAQLLAAFPGLRMVATDYDTDMVRAARTALAPFGGRASAEQADAAALPFADNRFDLVLSAAMLHHVGAWEKALAEAIRVLRTGGRLIGYDLLDTPPVRLMHLGGGHGTRLLRPGQLEGELDRLGATDVRATTSLGGLVIRFNAAKAAASSTGS